MNLNMYDHPKTGDYKSNCKQKKNYIMANQKRKKKSIFSGVNVSNDDAQPKCATIWI